MRFKAELVAREAAARSIVEAAVGYGFDLGATGVVTRAEVLESARDVVDGLVARSQPPRRRPVSRTERRLSPDDVALVEVLVDALGLTLPTLQRLEFETAPGGRGLLAIVTEVTR